ncbi:unnamed protein product, partial [Prunus brigantina]
LNSLSSLAIPSHSHLILLTFKLHFFSLAIPTITLNPILLYPVTITLSSLSPSASLFFTNFFFVLHLCHHLFLYPKRERAMEVLLVVEKSHWSPFVNLRR